ncbi:MAG TPA: hypothetical protein VD978_27075 [Azospirillum sp.]|nr:hypothetical protein [Azospirillum sp.]
MGEGGDDLIVGGQGSGHDEAFDFNAAEGDRIVLSPGMTWGVSDVPNIGARLLRH